jgi:hypothetical protein
LTETENISKKITFLVENATIALIPQIIRLNNAFEKTIEYVNLVSTYSAPYTIKSVETNISTLLVYCNNYTSIFENQWIGMAIIYEPYSGK